MNMHENGESIEIKPRKITIYNIELIKIDKEQKEIYFKVSCSKGTYIRSLCEDIAEKLGTIGYMKDLNRIKVGRFDINQAITIEQIEKNGIEFAKKNIITMKRLFENNEKIELDNGKILKWSKNIH